MEPWKGVSSNPSGVNVFPYPPPKRKARKDYVTSLPFMQSFAVTNSYYFRDKVLYSQSLTAGCKLISLALKKYKHSYELHTFVIKWDVFMKKINVTNGK